MYNIRMWRSRTFWRLFGAYCILLCVSLGFLGGMLIRRIESHLLEETRLALELKTLLIGEIANVEPEATRQREIKRLAAETRTRITLIAADGAVLADSAEPAEPVENHGDRPEIKEAAQSGVGVVTRYSGTVHQPMMYVARRQETGPIRFVRLALPLDAVADEIRWLGRAVWTTVGVTLALALLLSLVLARRISAPLVELAEAAKSIAAGEYGKRVLLPTGDEVGALAASFNEMSVACANQIAQMDHDRQQLLAIFRGMVEGVVVLDAEQSIQFLNEAAAQLLDTNLSAAQGRKIWHLFRHRQLGEAVDRILASDDPLRCELEWAGPERKVFAVHGTRLPGEPIRGAVLVFHDITHLRKLERVRQDFVANVSHELKTPLAAIQATVETLLDGALQDSEHNVRFLERVRENADRLHRLVQDLLTLGRIESGQEIMEIQPIALQPLIESCLSRQSDRAKGKGLVLEQASADESVYVMADEDALAEIVDNLLDNAIKYTPQGQIRVRWFREGDHAVLEVSDSGVGIPEKDLPRVFERFYRVDKARSRELGGTGLGLSIVKHLVHTLSGTITATSEVAVGSTFSVRLPAAAEPSNV